MSHIWTFSPESKTLLRQCLNAAAPPADSNKWVQKFGIKNFALIEKVEDPILLEDSPVTESITTVQEDTEEDISKVLEEINDPEWDLISKFHYLEEKSINKPRLLLKLAETLPLNTKEVLVHHVFSNKDVNSQFLNIFFEYFPALYIKKDNTRSSTNLLLKTYNIYPQYFSILLKVILKDLEIQNNILNDFILSLNASEQSDFLNTLCSIDLASEEFSHNLFNINTAYKNCNKAENVQNNIFSLLKTHSEFCTIDKNYGKLLLAFLQHEKSLMHSSYSELESIVEAHKSPFRRPCLTILKELNVH